jgi:predicted dehydrogenase
MVVYDDIKVSEKLMIYDKGVNVLSGDNIEYDDYVVKTRDGDVWIPYIPQEDALYNSINHFLDCILKNKESLSGPKQGIRLLKILSAADENMNK